MRRTSHLSEKCYYAIHVVAQFASADDWGSADDPVGFYEGYDPENGITGPSEDALFLLHQAAGKDYELVIAVAEDAGAEAKGQETLEVQRGEMLQLQSYVTCMDRIIEEQQVTWSVRGAASPNTEISADGVLSIGADEPAEVVKVTASDGEKVSGERFIKVIP